MWTSPKPRQPPGHQRWSRRGVCGDKLECRLPLDAWRRLLDAEEPGHRD